MVVIVVGVVAVACFAFHKRRKHTDGYAFQRMTFVNAEGTDEQNDDADEQDNDANQQNDKES